MKHSDIDLLVKIVLVGSLVVAGYAFGTYLGYGVEQPESDRIRILLNKAEIESLAQEFLDIQTKQRLEALEQWERKHRFHRKAKREN